MKLTDLLDELRNNILNDRGASTGDDDKLWSNKTLVRYINEAQRRFAKRAYCIWDAVTPEVVDVTLVAGQVEYDIHPSIISVVSAKLEGSQTDLARIGHVLLGEYRTGKHQHPVQRFADRHRGRSSARVRDGRAPG
jgi:hypothetical protein